MTVLFGLIALGLLLWMANKYLKADPRKLAAMAKLGVGVAMLGFAAFLAVRGQFALAVPLALAGLGLVGWVPYGAIGWGGRKEPVSRVRSALVEMEFGHDSGTMRGVILAGPHVGKQLDAIGVETLAGLLGGIDEDSRALLAAYLDRRDTGWRKYAKADAATGRRSAASGPMTEQEAYQILGLEAGASAEDIARVHRTLMKRLHPDLGGTNYLAARINEAKDTLLRHHR